eukprot:CAMPEP_0178901840 /NCGR_PEP_ID=MMETSP0786-20121207/4264_1 /TAXON_ID=186022 /ORGANISM="Thalassionema frauenfeldii, Strain CCMP 1798" /LENGTH=60 /DNA_ID=CAMNT_0020573023 /DNA_START=663 /DNA_END=845 /DNA_ORIENTATION=-
MPLNLAHASPLRGGGVMTMIGTFRSFWERMVVIIVERLVANCSSGMNCFEPGVVASLAPK